MDDLRFYVLLNCISVISGRCLDDNRELTVYNDMTVQECMRVLSLSIFTYLQKKKNKTRRTNNYN